MGSIYKITNKKTGKAYIGKTEHTARKRFVSHLRNARLGIDTHLYKSIRLHGVSAFDVEEIECCPNEVLNEREKFWIEHFDTFKNGYNMTIGGTGGDVSWSENYQKAMKLRVDAGMYSGANNNMYGKSAMRGKKHTPESIKKQSDIRKKYWENEENLDRQRFRISGEKNPMFGKTPRNAKEVVVDDVTYPSITAAMKHTGLSASKIKRMNRK